MEYYTVQEFANLIRISERQVRILCERGEVKALKLGRLWRIHKSALEVGNQ